MKLSQKLLLVPVLVVAFVAAGGLAYFLHFYRHKASLDAKYAASEKALAGYREWLEGRPSTEEKLNEIVGRTLGFSGEVVDSRFRSGLTRMAEIAGLDKDKIVVTPKASTTMVKNPTVEPRTGVADFKRYLSQDYISAPDLYIMEAQIRGSGTFDAVSRLLALAQTQPWIWSVRGFTLKPQNDSATMFDITVDVTTAILPDRAPAASGTAEAPVDAPQILNPPAESVASIASIVRRNVFAPPPPPPEEIKITQGDSAVDVGANPDPGGVQPPALPPPYHEWRLTGVSGSPSQGRLAWMLNVRTGSAVLLSPGQGVLDAVLVKAEGSEAVFQIGEVRFLLALNETLADRHRLE